jgi:hypothetical protein
MVYRNARSRKKIRQVATTQNANVTAAQGVIEMARSNPFRTRLRPPKYRRSPWRTAVNMVKRTVCAVWSD